MFSQCQTTESFARDLDRRDPLRRFRKAFYHPENTVYLDGNSLGLLCRPAEDALLQTVLEWRTLAIRGWLESHPPWFELAERLGMQLAPLIGAEPDEVIVANSTTVNLHQLLATFYDPQAAAAKILADELCFPSDRYALQSFLRLLGKQPDQIRFVESRDGLTLDERQLVRAMDDGVQLVVLPSVLYVSGQLLDIAHLTDAAHRRGAMIGFDCSHSVGVVPHQLSRDRVDFAFFSTYKYLNGGPGSVAGIYLNRRHFGRRAGLAGWFGCQKSRQFEMDQQFHQAAHAGGLQIGTPPVLSAAPLRGSLQLIHEAGIDSIRRKSLQLTGYLRSLIETCLAEFDIECVEPSDNARRGGHVAVRHEKASALSRALRSRGVIPDYRDPDILRLAPAPLYTSYTDCFQAVKTLEQIMREGNFEDQADSREAVT